MTCGMRFASLLLAFGYMIPYVSQQLGHSSAKITLETYGHILEEGAPAG